MTKFCVGWLPGHQDWHQPQRFSSIFAVLACCTCREYYDCDHRKIYRL